MFSKKAIAVAITLIVVHVQCSRNFLQGFNGAATCQQGYRLRTIWLLGKSHNCKNTTGLHRLLYGQLLSPSQQHKPVRHLRPLWSEPEIKTYTPSRSGSERLQRRSSVCSSYNRLQISTLVTAVTKPLLVPNSHLFVDKLLTL